MMQLCECVRKSRAEEKQRFQRNGGWYYTEMDTRSRPTAETVQDLAGRRRNRRVHEDGQLSDFVGLTSKNKTQSELRRGTTVPLTSAGNIQYALIDTESLIAYSSSLLCNHRLRKQERY